MRRASLALLLLCLVALESFSEARLFNQHGKQLKRTVGKRRRGTDGRAHYKEVDADQFGRAAFDPHYGLDEELAAEDLGYDTHDIHDATPSVIEHRLRELFPAIDTNHDGVISSEELQRHLYVNGMAISRRRAEAEFNDTDTNHDGRVSAAEYLATLVDEEDPHIKASLAKGGFPDPLDYGSYVDVTRAAFVFSDLDHDGGLNQEEFYDFLNPEEGSNINLKLHRLRQDIFDHLQSSHHSHGHEDTAHHPPAPGSLTLTFDQFYDYFWGQFTVWEHGAEAWSEDKEKESAMRKFVLLDTNSDNKLSAEELLPAYADIHPTESRYARMQAEHMMDMAECTDGHLTLDQMLRVPHAFYGVVHDHDEL